MRRLRSWVAYTLILLNCFIIILMSAEWVSLKQMIIAMFIGIPILLINHHIITKYYFDRL